MWVTSNHVRHIGYHSRILFLKQVSMWEIFSRPGRSQGLLHEHRCHWLIDSLSKSALATPSPRHAQTVWNGAASHKIDCVAQVLYTSKDIKIPYSVKNLQQFCETGGFCIWVELHQRDLRAACEPGLLCYRYSVHIQCPEFRDQYRVNFHLRVQVHGTRYRVQGQVQS